LRGSLFAAGFDRIVRPFLPGFFLVLAMRSFLFGFVMGGSAGSRAKADVAAGDLKPALTMAAATH
jgi:hypothetical protein